MPLRGLPASKSSRRPRTPLNLDAIRAGASGYLTKDTDAGQSAAIATAAAGDFSPAPKPADMAGAVLGNGSAEPERSPRAKETLAWA